MRIGTFGACFFWTFLKHSGGLQEHKSACIEMQFRTNAPTQA
jgi:hypothetical protein